MPRKAPALFRRHKPRKLLCNNDEMTEVRNLRPRKTVLLVLCTVALLIIGVAAFRFTRAAPAVPTAVASRGEFVNYLAIRGETKAGSSTTLEAPPRPDSLEILKIAANGTKVKPGDAVIEFDATSVKQSLAQDESALKSSDAQIEQARAQARMKEEQDLTDVMKARYDVQSAQLDASKSDIESKIDGDEAELKVTDAQQKLKEVETKLKTDQETDAATIKGVEQKREQSVFQVQQDHEGLQHLVLKAPAAGVVTIDMNYNTGGPGSAPFKPGDRTWPGAALAELPDLSTLYVSARVDETERGSLQLGEKASIRVDGIPDREFTGTISGISDVASMDFSAPYPYPKNFTMKIALQDRDQRLRPGMTANIRVAMDRIANAILIPPLAVFQKSGGSVAYVLRGAKFDERAIEVAGRSEDEVLVARGLRAGDRVALKDPTVLR